MLDLLDHTYHEAIEDGELAGRIIFVPKIIYDCGATSHQNWNVNLTNYEDCMITLSAKKHMGCIIDIYIYIF